MAELAAIAREITGDPYRYDPCPDAWWEARWRSRGRQPWQIEAGLTSYQALRAGEQDVVTDDFERLTGRRARSVREVVEALRDRLPLSRAVPP
jgi:NAD(P)H dehydrogenase (quinone)